MAPAEEQEWLQYVLYRTIPRIQVQDDAIYHQELKVTQYGTMF